MGGHILQGQGAGPKVEAQPRDYQEFLRMPREGVRLLSRQPCPERTMTQPDGWVIDGSRVCPQNMLGTAVSPVSNQVLAETVKVEVLGRRIGQVVPNWPAPNLLPVTLKE